MKNETVLTNGVRKVKIIKLDDNGKQILKSGFNRAEYVIEHFDFMGQEEQKIAKEWYACRKAKKIWNDVERRTRKRFFNLLNRAVNEITEEYCIANIEPSIAQNGRIYYREGEKVARGLSCNEWKKKALEFAPECDSDLATQYQLVLWYAYRIAMGYWTVEYVCDDSSSEGNYWNSPNCVHTVEVSGARRVGGARDGVGNTKKIVTDGGVDFILFGGFFGHDGSECPVTDFGRIEDPDHADIFCSGVVVLNKVQTTSHG